MDHAVPISSPGDSEALRLRAFEPVLAEDFRRLNLEWLQRYFRVEPIDAQVMDDPQRHILDCGGSILFAALGDRIVGCGALLRESPGVYEVSKMAVTESVQGRGIGRALLRGLIEVFRARGGSRLFLESHSSLGAALALYASEGFIMQPARRADAHYARSDVHMIWQGSAGREA